MPRGKRNSVKRMTLVHLKTGDTIEADAERVKEDGLPEDFLDAESLTIEMWLDIIENLRRIE